MHKRNNVRLRDKEIQTLKNIYRLMDQKGMLKPIKTYAIKKELMTLKDCYNIRLLEHLLNFVMAKHPKISLMASDFIDNIMGRFDTEDFVDLDGLFRNTNDYYYSELTYSPLLVDDIKKYIGRRGANKSVVALLTFYGNGYIRELALKKLYDIHVEYSLICSLIRLNDWVKSIRDLSFDHVKNIISEPMNARHLLMTLALIEKVSRGGRSDHTEIKGLYNVYYKLNIGDEMALDLYDNTNNNKLKRSLYAYIKAHCKDSKTIVNIGVKTRDLVVLRGCLDYIKAHITEGPVQAEVHKFLNHKLYMARIFYLDYLYNDDPGDLEEILAHKLFDKSAGVRSLAGFYLKKKFNVDVLAYYREVLKCESNVIISMKALADLSDTDSYEPIKLFISHTSENIVLTALSALSKLDFERSKEVLYEMLISDREVYSRRARKLLRKHRLDYKYDHLKALIDHTEKKHVVDNIFLLSEALYKWEALKLLLYAYKVNWNAPGDRRDAFMRRTIYRINGGYTRPSPEEAKEVLALLDDVEDTMEYSLSIKHVLSHHGSASTR